MQSSLRSGLSTLPLKSRDSLTKHSAIYFLIDENIVLEEVAWAETKLKDECSKEKRCISGKYVCDRHRVIVVEICRTGVIPRISFVTVGDVQDNTTGRKFSVSMKSIRLMFYRTLFFHHAASLWLSALRPQCMPCLPGDVRVGNRSGL